MNDLIRIRIKQNSSRKHKPPVKDVLSRNDSSDRKKTKNDFGSSSMNEYLLGSRKLKPFPVSMSLIAR